MCEGFVVVVGIDNLNDYFDPAARLMRLLGLNETQQAESAEFEFLEMDLAERQAISGLMKGQNSMWFSQFGGASWSALLTGKPSCLC